MSSQEACVCQEARLLSLGSLGSQDGEQNHQRERIPHPPTQVWPSPLEHVVKRPDAFRCSVVQSSLKGEGTWRNKVLTLVLQEATGLNKQHHIPF